MFAGSIDDNMEQTAARIESGNSQMRRAKEFQVHRDLIDGLIFFRVVVLDIVVVVKCNESHSVVGGC